MTTTTSTRPVWKAALLGGILAAAATMAIAAIAKVADISLDVDGEPIPLPGFFTLTLAATLIGYVLAITLNRWAPHPRRTFLVITVALTAASLIPDLIVPMAGSTRPVLMLAHLVAAAIVIPAIASRLEEQR